MSSSGRSAGSSGSGIPLSSTAYLDLCQAWNDGNGPIGALSPAAALTVTFTGSSTTATVTAGTAPASGAIIADLLPAGTTFTASGSTLTLSQAATSSGSGALAYAGTDATSAIQAALNYFNTKNLDGTIQFSRPGVYLVNGAQQTGTALTRAYSGQLVFPARALSVTSPTINIRIKGTQAFGGMPGGGMANSAGGVILLGTPGTGSMFDAISGYSLVGKSWTAIVAQFEDIVLRVPTNPQGNVVNGTGLAGMMFRGACLIDTITTTGPTNQTGTGYAVKWPLNGNMAMLRQTGELAINGYPNAIAPGEHLTAECLFIQSCSTAFVFSPSVTHAVQLDKVCLQGVTTGISVADTDAHVTGYFDIGDQPPTDFISDTNNYLYGDIVVAPINYTGTNPGLGFPSNGGQSAAIRPAYRRPNAWPSDTFKRINVSLPATYTHGPGGTDRTGHIWAPTGAMIFPSGGGMTAASGANPKTWLRYNAGRPQPSRIVRAKVTLGATGYNFWLILGKIVSSSATTGMYAQLNGGLVNIQRVVNNTATTVASSSAGVVAANTAYTVDVVVSNPYSVAGLYTLTVFINGTQVATYTLSSSDATSLADTEDFLTQDGFGMFGDTSTKLTEFAVLPN